MARITPPLLRVAFAGLVQASLAQHPAIVQSYGACNHNLMFGLDYNRCISLEFDSQIGAEKAFFLPVHGDHGLYSVAVP